ncbi:MAG: hypothetical protein FWG44_02160, partial [Oscillospiraceae bacterium]|nr:hypothetical protein [Oscillospiraceae bacterium]
MKKMSIRKKISSLTVRISLISVIIIGAIAVAGLLILRANTVKISGELGETAAADSRNALESQMTDRLMMLAANKASLSDSTLKLIQSSVEMIAAEAQQIEQNPERYKPNPVDSPSADNNGIMAAQFLWAENAEPSVYSENASLMGNIEGLLKSIIDNNINAASDFNAVINYIGSEHGYIIIVDDASGTKSEFFDPRERPWYKLAAGNDSLSWTDVYSDAYGRGLAITCAKPYYDNDGKIAGVAGVGTILTELTEIVVGTNVGETGYAFMLNEQGQI